MSGLFGELQRTAQALNAQSQGIYTAGRNMANVNNPAYARQRVQIGDRGTVQTTLGPQSLGVEVLDLQNIRDALLDGQVVRETSTTSSLSAESDAYSKAELALGQQVSTGQDAEFIDGATTTTSSNSLGEALDNLLNAFSSLAASPRSTGERQVLLQQAQTLASRLHTVDNRLIAVEDDINEQIASDVDEVNALLTTISNLSKQIGRFEVGNPGSALDLRDQRQAKLEELAKYIDIDVEDATAGGGQIRILSRDASNNPVELLDSSKAPTGLTFDGTNVSGGSPATVLSLAGGSIHGNLKARDGAIADLRSGLDTFASQIVTSVNDAYNPGGAGTDFFAAAGTTAATIAVDSTVTVSNIRATNTAEAGANEVALAISQLATKSFSTGAGDLFDGSFGSYYRGLVSDLANTAATTSSLHDDQSTLQNLVLSRRDSVSGVSLDEEMTDLIRYQKAFDASARVMRIVDEMLDTVVNGLVR